ncbi:MAG: UDP-N-acetylmuramoyl-L-alanine--D-glutamate ligase [Opitutaceae bacterium]|nr:UDP-N-acetylmuramoyl-L-alanine--D-glutamate ligase [Opitutaceae bacterium]
MLVSPQFLIPLLKGPIAVLGGGVSGSGVLALLAALGAEGELFDEKTAGSEFTTMPTGKHRLVIFSPGFRPDHPWLVKARSNGQVCLGELDFASLFWRGSVIAITGTNGKTTLTEFLTHALRLTGRDAAATGNVGHSFSRLVAERGGGAPDSVAVCEVSSFQAEPFQVFRADAAIWTNFAEDHLERHPGMQAYFMAKWRLFERTVGGEVYAGSSVQTWAAQFGQTLPASACVATLGQPGDVLLRHTVFDEYPQRENFLLAAAWWRGAGLRESALYAAAQSFKIGPHRLSKVAERAGVSWWNDSKATNFHATEAALEQFRSPVIMILGGKAKGGDIAAFAARIAPKVKHAFLLGETAPTLAEALRALRLSHTLTTSLSACVRGAAALAAAGDNVLLSPGFSSLDQFRGYDDRGCQFEELVSNL